MKIDMAEPDMLLSLKNIGIGRTLLSLPTFNVVFIWFASLKNFLKQYLWTVSRVNLR